MNGVEVFRRGSVGLFELLPRYFPEARCWRENGLLILIAGRELISFNGVLALDQDALTESRISSLEQLFTSHNVPIAFEFYSENDTAACHDLLTEQEYALVVSEPIMICEGPLYLSRPINANVQIRSMNGAPDHELYRRIMMEAFQMPADTARELFETMLNIGEGYQVLAWLDDQAVGCGMLLYTGGVASIYNVGTLPSAQKQGVGTATMLALHQHALDDGYEGTVLSVQSSAGYSLYKSLGYRQDGYQLIYVIE